jgi:hypothetical protein
MQGGLLLIGLGLGLGLGCGPRPAPKVARPATCDVGATWVGSAIDPAGTDWELVMVLHQDASVVGGTVEWQRDDGRRVLEEVRGLVACADGVVTLHSVPPATSYRLELAADDASMTGRFESESEAGRPGTITASRRDSGALR